MSLFVIVLLLVPFEGLRALSLSKRLVIEAIPADRARVRIQQGDY